MYLALGTAIVNKTDTVFDILEGGRDTIIFLKINCKVW